MEWLEGKVKASILGVQITAKQTKWDGVSPGKVQGSSRTHHFYNFFGLAEQSDASSDSPSIIFKKAQGENNVNEVCILHGHKVTTWIDVCIYFFSFFCLSINCFSILLALAFSCCSYLCAHLPISFIFLCVSDID